MKWLLKGNRIITAVFKGNPKTVIISCSPHNHLPVEEAEEFYQQLSTAISLVPPHAMLLISGDFNARIIEKCSYHQSTDRNGSLLKDFLQQENLLAGNTLYQKPVHKLCTWRHPAGHLSQIKYILFRKRWRNSIHNFRVYSSSNSIGSNQDSSCHYSTQSTCT